MYHCHVNFYYIGNQSQLLDVIRNMPAFAPCEHAFMESKSPSEEFAAKADVILADLRGTNAADIVRTLAAWKKPGTDLILLAEQEQYEDIANDRCRTAFSFFAVAAVP